MERKIAGPVVLVVLDGWGIEEAHEQNGIALAKTPNFDSLADKYPYTKLEASGEAVGLPEGQMGNSEVGHTTIGAGCVIYQDLVRITKDAKNGDFVHNPAMKEAFEHAKNNGTKLHIMGLLSDGGVHSHEDHLLEVARAARECGVAEIVLHPFLDGRDAAPHAGANSIRKLKKHADEIGNCKIATIIGRYYAMDRDKNWERTDKAFKAIWNGEATHYFEDSHPIEEALEEFYKQSTSDEHIEPIVIKGEQDLTVQPGDSLIFTNFRTDRTKQLSAKICEVIEDQNLCFVTMTDYGRDVTSIVAYEPQSIEATLASAIDEAGMNQAHIAETEKYPHATYFLNGGKEDTHAKEEHVLIPSNKHVKTHDEAPEMKAKEICDATIERLTTNDFIFVNFANPDMVGHTAKKEAIIVAVETVDKELGRLAEAVISHNGAILAIADHGNAERMIDPETGSPHTSHTTNLVPCILITKKYSSSEVEKLPQGKFSTGSNNILLPGGGLKEVAPTILDLLGVQKPKSMTGKSLVK